MIFTLAILTHLGSARSAVKTAPIVWAGSTAKRMRMRKSKNFLICPGGGKITKKIIDKLQTLCYNKSTKREGKPKTRGLADHACKVVSRKQMRCKTDATLTK